MKICCRLERRPICLMVVGDGTPCRAVRTMICWRAALMKTCSMVVRIAIFIWSAVAFLLSMTGARIAFRAMTPMPIQEQLVRTSSLCRALAPWMQVSTALAPPTASSISSTPPTMATAARRWCGCWAAGGTTSWISQASAWSAATSSSMPPMAMTRSRVRCWRTRSRAAAAKTSSMAARAATATG